MSRMRHSTSRLRPLRDLGAKGAVLPGPFCVVFFLALLLYPLGSDALDRQQAEAIPHVNQQARDNFLEYLYADPHKAFAIAPGGSWAWSAQQASFDEARQQALHNCQTQTQQHCVLYAVNDELVFDQQAWPQLWRLDNQAANTPSNSNIRRGSPFPDLRFHDRAGRSYQLSHFKGKPVLVHFWGSWCPPCMREMPSLLQLQQALQKQHGNDIVVILLQVREPFSRSLAWSQQQGFADLPLYDSGVKDSQDSQLNVVGGRTIADRKLARAFPSSYVLDSKGRVVFSHTGPIHDWLEYLPFFSDLIAHDKDRTSRDGR